MAAASAKRTKKRLGRPRQPWSEPEGYRIELQAYAAELDRYLQTTTDNVVYFTYAKRVDRLSVPVKTLTGEIGTLLAPFGGFEWPLWPAAYVPCGPNGRALYYMSEVEMEVLRDIMVNCRPRILERLKNGKCMVAGINSSRLLAGFPEMRQYVVADTKGAEPGSGPCCVPYPCEWHKLHGDDLIPLHNKLTVIFGEGFPDLQTFERQINNAYRRVRISVGLWYYQSINWSEEKRDAYCEKLKAKWVGNDARKEQLSRLCKLRWATRRDEFITKIKATWAKPEVREKASQSAKRLWQEPETRVKRAHIFENKDFQQARRQGFQTMSKEKKQSHSDNVSAGRLERNGKTKEADTPAAFGVRLPPSLTTDQLAAVLVMLRRHYDDVVPDPVRPNVHWALSRHNHAIRSGAMIRRELCNLGVSKHEIGDRGWYWMSPIDHHPSNRAHGVITIDDQEGGGGTASAAATTYIGAFRVCLPVEDLTTDQLAQVLAILRMKVDGVVASDVDGEENIFWGLLPEGQTVRKIAEAIRCKMRALKASKIDAKARGSWYWAMPIESHPSNRGTSSSSSVSTS